ncbi:DUF6338 family protein [Rathayibacter toxicus]|uniref:DUF6338 family protein n=1 Tax=Rathayibacter toxicus TaxID=145458 RepID=UPI001FE49F53|nr:DUF6338 family protein [Rathayibacter toxicus]
MPAAGRAGIGRGPTGFRAPASAAVPSCRIGGAVRSSCSKLLTLILSSGGPVAYVDLGVPCTSSRSSPGIAFIFAREGHRAVSKKSALRETATVVFVSAICAAVLGLVTAIVAAFCPEFRNTVGDLLGGNLTWGRENWPIAIFLAVVALVLATLLGRLMGSKWAFKKGLKKIGESDIPRDISPWTQLFTTDSEETVVEVALTLKSGAWVSGLLHSFDNDPDPHPVGRSP